MGNRKGHIEGELNLAEGPLRPLLLSISLRLNSIESKQTEGEIEAVLDLVARNLGFVEIGLVCWPGEGGAGPTVKRYPAEGSYSRAVPPKVDDAPWLMKRLRSGETVSLPHLPNDLPAYAARDKSYFAKEGISSGLGVPLKAGTLAMGGLLAFSSGKESPFSAAWVEDFSCLAEILSAALSRKKAAERMDEILAHEHLLSEISATYINLSVTDIDKVMSRDLGRLAQLLRADRCILYLAEEGGETFRPYLHSGWWLEADRERVVKYSRLWDRHDPEFIDAFQYLFTRWIRGEHVQWTQQDRLPHEAQRMKEAYRIFGLKSQLSVPVSVSGRTVAVLTVSSNTSYKIWPDELIPRLRLFGEVFANALARKRSEEALQAAFAEVHQLKERFEADYIYLRDSLQVESDFRGIVGKSEALKGILTKVKQVAATDVTVLLLGETGTGKGLIARALHNESKRRDRPLMQVNCAALTPSLIESELFGHEKGAFTGATTRRIGRFESARGTTLFLDEVGELPMGLQAKLLRVLQDGEFERVGGSGTMVTDARVIAATNRNLEEDVKNGRFRSDLWYRLNIFPIHVPPLRERVEDIPLFVSFFVEKYGKWIGKEFDSVPQKTIKALQRYEWPGNIRELENIIERAVITSQDGKLEIEPPSCRKRLAVERTETLADFEREFIVGVLKERGWKVKGESGAAKSLGLKPSTLRTRMEKLGIKRP